MDEELFKLKVKCLLHDPTVKPLVLRTHEELARKIMERLNERLPSNLKFDSSIDASIKHADWVAASSDRLIISELYNDILDMEAVYAVNILDIESGVVNIRERVLNYLPPNWSINYPERFIRRLLGDEDQGKLDNNVKPHILYHIIWRFLIEATVESLNNIKEAALMPADTRVPYYTIFDHLYTASAMIVSLKDDPDEGKLGMIHWESIGVQRFIKESRAFRDLWASSFLISLINTGVIIRLAKEHGFDSILSPNMLYNPLVDLYLYAHTKDERLLVELDDLKTPVTPDKGFAIVPYDKVSYYSSEIPKWFNALWRKIAESVKGYIETRLDKHNASAASITNTGTVLTDSATATTVTIDIYKQYVAEWGMNNITYERILSIEDTDADNINYWDYIWELCGYDTPIDFVCTGDSFKLAKENMENMLKEFMTNQEDNEKYEELINTIRIFRNIATSKYTVAKDFQLFEFPIIIDMLKKRRKLVSMSPRPEVPKWLLYHTIYIKDRRGICTVCYIRPAVIFASKSVMRSIPVIKEDERLCPICLIKRMLATEEVFIDILSKVFFFADDSIREEEYRLAIKKIFDTFKDRLSNEYIRKNPLSIPSLDTFATITFRSSCCRLVNDDLVQRFIEVLDSNDFPLYINAPNISWFDYKIETESKKKLQSIGGEFFIIEEYQSQYEEKKEKLRELNDIIGNMGKELSRINPDQYKDVIVATRPSKYVTLIRADGDDMGKLLTLTNEKFAKKINDILLDKLCSYLRSGKLEGTNYTIEQIIQLPYIITPSFYASVSRALAMIARAITKIGDKYATSVVYAGGDDILAISPPELSLLFAHHARKVFSLPYIQISTNNSNTKLIITGLGNKVTQSFSIKFFHIFAPLDKILRESYEELESVAKKIKGKDGLVITYTARGGSNIQAILKWKLNKSNEIVNNIFNLTSLTLKYKRIIDEDSSKNHDLEYDPTNLNIYLKEFANYTSISHRAFRDIVSISKEDYREDVIITIAKNELRRHSTKMLNELTKIIDDVKGHVIISDSNYEKRLYALIELAKAVLAFYNALDSRPIVLGVKI